MSTTWKKWAPAVVIPAVIIAAGIVVPLQASAAVALPTKTPQQVLELASESTVKAFSGDITQTSDLGLPDLSGLTTGTSTTDITSVLALLTGNHSARVYVDGATKQRVQVLDSMSEQDVIRNGNAVWTWDSKTSTATQLKLPASEAQTGKTVPVPPSSETVPTPSTLAAKFLAAIHPSTTVAVGTNLRVAGRSAYTLILTPKTSNTLVKSVSIAIDAQTGLALSVDVQAKGQSKPAFELAFTSLSLTTPDASLFTFTPPKGATVKQQALPTRTPSEPGRSTPMHSDLKGRDPASAAGSGSTKKPVTIGTGWSAIVELPASASIAKLGGSNSGAGSSSTQKLLKSATTAVAGGRIFTSTLLTVLLTDDGRIFAGAVPASILEAAASK